MRKAYNEAATETTKRQIHNWKVEGRYHSLALPNGQIAVGTQSVEQLEARLAQFQLPEDLTGARVLDVGAWDGWFSFELERRGTQVVAIDAVDQPKLRQHIVTNGSSVVFEVCSVYDLSPELFGRFDIVLFLGVLYHLKHPLLGLERVCSVSNEIVCVESYVREGDLTQPPQLDFYETTELCGQFDNWIGPNTSCLMALCRSVGFADVELKSVVLGRAPRRLSQALEAHLRQRCALSAFVCGKRGAIRSTIRSRQRRMRVAAV